MELTYKLHELDVAASFILKNSSSKTLLFYGDMGAGKTTLIKEILRILGTNDTISSPTFSLVNHYESDAGAVYHFDFYRISDEQEALDIGFSEYLDSDSWKLIEWPQKVERIIGGEGQKIQLKAVSKDSRKLKFC